MPPAHKIKDKLLPSVFDRLTDTAPRRRVENKSAMVMNIKQYKDSVLRDIMNILNTNALFTLVDQEEIPNNILASTINYGSPALSGSLIANIDWYEVEEQLRLSIINFEPRLLANSVKVKIHLDDEYQISQNRLVIEIQGKLTVSPYSNELWLRTAMDVETGSFQLMDRKANEQ